MFVRLKTKSVRFSSSSLDSWLYWTCLFAFECNPFSVVLFEIRLASVRMIFCDKKSRARHQREFNAWWQNPLENRAYVCICTRETTSPMKRQLTVDGIESREVDLFTAHQIWVRQRIKRKSVSFLLEMCSSFAQRFLLVRRFTFKWPMSSRISIHLNCNIVLRISIEITV